MSLFSLLAVMTMMGCTYNNSPHNNQSQNHSSQAFYQNQGQNQGYSHRQHSNYNRQPTAYYPQANAVHSDYPPMMSEDNHHHHHNHSHDNMAYDKDGQQAFEQWLYANGNHSERVSQVANYQRYLKQRLGKYAVPPMWQLLTTARDWQGCHQEQFEVPPQALWENILPTLRLYAKLKHQGILPNSSQIRSTYRNPELNACAGGASNSSHKYYQAIDIWVPEYEGDTASLQQMNAALCQYWRYQGAEDNFGLGLYKSGAIHIDTAKYRTWGGNHSAGSSFCAMQ